MGKHARGVGRTGRTAATGRPAKDRLSWRPPGVGRGDAPIRPWGGRLDTGEPRETSPAPSPPGGEAGPPVLEERRGSCLILTLNRPARLNAVALPLYEALADAVAAAEEDGDVRAVVVTGAGRGFSVGADLQAYAEAAPSADDRRRYVAAGQRANRALQRTPLPVVAAVNGHAIGAGLELALSADLVVVSSDAKLRFPEAALGTFVGGGVTWTLPRRVGLARARELLLLGRFFTPDEALRMGLANEVVPPEVVLPRALELAGELAARAPRSVRLLKDLLRLSFHAGPDRLLEVERDALLECMDTGDWREGIRAFQEGREPRFTGE